MIGVAHCAPTVCSVGFAALFACPMSSVPTELIDPAFAADPMIVTVTRISNENATLVWEATVVHAAGGNRIRG